MKTNRQKCIDMWEWIISNPGSSKIDWIQTFPDSTPDVEGNCYCYACKEDDEIRARLCINNNDKVSHCENCPVTWTKNDGDCEDNGSPYVDWGMEDNKKRKHVYAKRVLAVILNTWEDYEDE